MSPRQRTLARWLIGLVLVLVLLSWLDLAAIRDRLAGVTLRLALPAMLGLVAVHIISALSWRRLTTELAGVRLDWRTTIRLYYAAQAFGTITPANIGADIYRVMAVAGRVGAARLARPVVIQRLTSIVAIMCLGLVGTLSLRIPGLGWFVVALVAIGTLVALAIIVLSSSPARRPAFVSRFLGRLGLDWGADRGVGRLRVAIRDGFGLGLIFHATSLVLGLVLVAAVDPLAAGRPLEVLGALAVARLSLAVPLSPNGIGIQEGLLTILFVQLGLPPDTAIAAALLNRLAFLATAALGSVALLVRGRSPAVAAPRPG